MPENRVAVPTAWDARKNKMLQGTVQDENCRLFNGKSGNAGIFSTVSDINKICQMLLNGGTFDSHYFLSEKTVFFMWQNHNPSNLPARGLGWDYNKKGQGYMSCGTFIPEGAVGHRGYTGTCLWIEPNSGLKIIIFTNRIHFQRPDSSSLMRKFLVDIHNLIGSQVFFAL